MSLKAYCDRTYGRRSRVHLGSLELDLFAAFTEPAALIAVYEEPKGGPIKNGEGYGLVLRATFHDGVTPITEVKLLARPPGLRRDTGHYDVATWATCNDWAPARRGSRASLKGGTAKTPAGASARAPRPDLNDDEGNIDYEDGDDDEEEDGSGDHGNSPRD